LNRTFRIWDDNADRKISYQEFVKRLSDFGASLTKTEAQQLFHSMDKNSSGNIEYDELLIALRV
jgi:Ca2+-binding EF-hand superfamily protein